MIKTFYLCFYWTREYFLKFLVNVSTVLTYGTSHLLGELWQIHMTFHVIQMSLSLQEIEVINKPSVIHQKCFILIISPWQAIHIHKHAQLFMTLLKGYSYQSVIIPLGYSEFAVHHMSTVYFCPTSELEHTLNVQDHGPTAADCLKGP